MSGRFTRISQRTDIVRKPPLIPMSAADRRDMELLNQRNEERRRAREQAERSKS